jgi:hypothetical protein
MAVWRAGTAVKEGFLPEPQSLIFSAALFSLL